PTAPGADARIARSNPFPLRSEGANEPNPARLAEGIARPGTENGANEPNAAKMAADGSRRERSVMSLWLTRPDEKGASLRAWALCPGFFRGSQRCQDGRR